MSNSSVEEIVEQAKAPGTFSIINVLKDRAYPTEEVDVYIDEDVAFLAAQVEEEINLVNNMLDDSAENTEILNGLIERRDALIAKRDKMVEDMGGNKYVFTIKGISEGVREDLYNLCIEKYPIEVNKKINPFTGQEESEEIENKDRSKMFTNLLWEAHIEKIVAPDGSVQNGINLEEAIELRRGLPIASSGKITEAIEKIRAATAVFMMTVNEDFLAKS